MAGAAGAPLFKTPPLHADTPTALFPRAQWIENGLIDAGGSHYPKLYGLSHEPYIFVVRRGGQKLNAHEIYEQAQSEAVIRHLREQGVEVFHTHLYKGFGMVAEMPEMEDARRAASIAHRYGMKVDTYIQWNTMMYETFFAEEPRAKDWIQRDVTGLPILLTYGYQQSFRYRPCFSCQEYLDYLKKVVRYAVEEAKTDFIHLDNFDLNPEPDSCHCRWCVEGFRNFLKAKYSQQERRERFGFENVDFMNPPQWNLQNPPQRLEIISDPAFQEWVDYRCQMMAGALKQVSLFARSLNRNVAIEINPGGLDGENCAWVRGIDHPRLLKWTDAFWSEEDDPPSYLKDGRLISKIRSFKLARACNNILMTYISADAVAMAECLSFNQTLGYVGEDPLSPEMLKYVRFYRENRDLYVGTQDVATVAVLRSYASIAYHNARAQLSAILVEQALIQSRMPFDLIFDAKLHDLSRYRVVVLPDSECLSNEQIALIRSFVENGGGIVGIGQAGLYDEWRRVRVEPGLKGLLEGQQPIQDYEQEKVKALSPSAKSAVRRECGKGRVVYVSEAKYDGPLPKMEPYFTIGNRYWKQPGNSAELLESIRWAARGDIPLEVSGPEYLVANLVEHFDRRQRMLHLVNYNAHETPVIESVRVRMRLPGTNPAKRIDVFSPDTAPQRLRFQATGSQASFVLSEVRTYAVVVPSW